MMASVSESIRQTDNSRCRICMFPKPNLSSLFRRGLSMKVMKLAEIKMYEGDGLPPTICLDCEVEVNRSVNFIGQIQRSDAKLREMLKNGTEFTYIFETDKELEESEQDASTSQIEIEEFNVKQEMILDNLLDEKVDDTCESDNDHYDVPLEHNDQPEEEAELNPLDHVDVVEDANRSNAMEVPDDPFGQEEPLIESQKNESEPSTDPLICLKQEAVSMDVDKNSPEPCGSTSTVKNTRTTNILPDSSTILQDQAKEKSGLKVQNYLIVSQMPQPSSVMTGARGANMPTKGMPKKFSNPENLITKLPLFSSQSNKVIGNNTSHLLILSTSNQQLSNLIHSPKSGTSNTQNLMFNTITTANTVTKENMIQNANYTVLNKNMPCNTGAQLLTTWGQQIMSTQSGTLIQLNPQSVNTCSNPIQQNSNIRPNLPKQIILATNQVSNVENVLPDDVLSGSSVTSNLQIPINGFGNARNTSQNSNVSLNIPNQQLLFRTNLVPNKMKTLPADLSSSDSNISSNLGISINSFSNYSSTTKDHFKRRSNIYSPPPLVLTRSVKEMTNLGNFLTDNTNIAKPNLDRRSQILPIHPPSHVLSTSDKVITNLANVPGNIAVPNKLLLAFVPVSKPNNNSTNTSLNSPIENKSAESLTRKLIGKPFECGAKHKMCNKDKVFNKVLLISRESMAKGKLQKYKEQLKREVQVVGDYFCFICKVECGNSELLKEHKEGKNFICRICTEEIVSHDELESHFGKHLLYECRFCKDIFVGKQDMFRHQDEKHSLDRSFKCELCDKGFFTKKSLSGHKSKQHNLGVRSIFKCEVCRKGFSRLCELKSHSIASHSPYEYMECKYCQKLVLGPEKMKIHIKLLHIDSDYNKAAACPSCGKVFKSLRTMIFHKKKLHDSERVKYKHKIQERLKEELSADGIFNCKFCNKQFENKILRKRHIDQEHRIRKTPTPVYCEICGKLFKSNQILKNHMLVHSDERPYKCEVCNATFRQPVALWTHSRVHSSIGVYNCLNCGMDFKWKQTLDKHVKKCASTDKVDS